MDFFTVGCNAVIKPNAKRQMTNDKHVVVLVLPLESELLNYRYAGLISMHNVQDFSSLVLARALAQRYCTFERR